MDDTIDSGNVLDWIGLIEEGRDTAECDIEDFEEWLDFVGFEE
jgi:hypothetical protein